MFENINFDYERSRRLFKEGFWIVLGQIMLVLGSLVGVRILTGLMMPSEYGELALGMTVATLVNQGVMGPLGNGVTRFYAPAVERADFGGYLKAVLRLVLSASGGIVFLFLIVVVGLLIVGKVQWLGIALAATMYAILSGNNSILNGIQNAARQRSVVALHQGIEPWSRFLIAAGLMVALGATSTVAMAGYVIAVILILVSQYLFFYKVVPPNMDETDEGTKWSTQIFNFSWPFAAWGIFTWAQLVSDRWALGIFGTMEEVGMYAVLFQLGYYPISMVTGMAMQFLAPIFYQRAGDASDSKRNTDVKKMSWLLGCSVLGVTLFAFLIVFFSHAYLFHLFVAKEYASVSYLLPWLILSGGIFAAGQTISLDLMSQMKTNSMVAPKIITALGGGILNFVGAYLFGIKGIVFANVIFSASYFIWMILISRRYFGELVAA